MYDHRFFTPFYPAFSLLPLFLPPSFSPYLSLPSPSIPPSPPQELADAPFYSDDDKGSDDDDEDSEEDSDGEGKKKKPPKRKPYVMDSDHRLLLRNCKPLLQSRNASVSYLK